MQPQTVFTPGQTPPPSMPAAPNNGQYDFITNYGANNSGGLFSPNAPMKTRLLVVGGGAGLLLVLALLFFALLSRPAGLSASTFISIMQEQTELARISQLPAQNATAQPTQNFAATAQLSLLSERSVFVAYLQAHGSSVTIKTLQLSKNLKTDQTLQAAQTSGTYDQTYLSIAQAQLTTYEHSLKQAFDASKSTSQRQLLNDAFVQAQLLLAQSKQTE